VLQLVLLLAALVRSLVQAALAMQLAVAVAVACPEAQLAVCYSVHTTRVLKQQLCTVNSSSSGCSNRSGVTALAAVLCVYSDYEDLHNSAVTSYYCVQALIAQLQCMFGQQRAWQRTLHLFVL
jgi:hypothetical protein